MLWRVTAYGAYKVEDKGQKTYKVLTENNQFVIYISNQIDIGRCMEQLQKLKRE